MTDAEREPRTDAGPTHDAPSATEADLKELLLAANEELLRRDLELERLRRQLQDVYGTRVWRLAARYVRLRDRALGVRRRLRSFRGGR